MVGLAVGLHFRDKKHPFFPRVEPHPPLGCDPEHEELRTDVDKKTTDRKSISQIMYHVRQT